MARPIRKTWTESQPCNDYDNNSRKYEEIQLGDDKLYTVTTFKYLGSIFDSNRGVERDINNRVKLAWMKWKQLTGVLCDKKVPIKLKDKICKTVIKSTMAYVAECWAVRKKYENRLHVTEMRMLRWIRGNTRKEHVSNQIVQEDAKSVPNVNIPETKTIALVRTCREKRRRKHIKKNDGHGGNGEEKKGTT